MTEISEIKTLSNLKNLIKLETLLIGDNPISSSLKDIKNSDILLSNQLKIKIFGSDSSDSTDIETNGSKVYYNLF